MQVPEIPQGIAQAILAADQTVADDGDPRGVRRLEVNEDGGLYVLNFAMDEGRGRVPWGETLHPVDFEAPAEGYTVIAQVQTWHPVYAGLFPRHSVAQVLAQLPEGLREQVAGVQFLNYVVAGVHHPVEPTEANNYLKGWALRQTRLYRHAMAKQ